MYSFQKAGGVAALIAAATYIVGIIFLLAVLDPSGYAADGADASQSVTFLLENQAIMYAWNMVIYVVNSVALVILALALYARLKSGSPAMAQTATAFGLIWAGLVLASGMVANVGLGAVVGLHASDPAGAATLWMTLSHVENGLGGGNEIAGGLWIALASLAALQAAAFPKALNYAGLVIGVSGLLTVVPAFEALGLIFGLGFIAWFVWLGIILLRAGQP